MSVGFEVDELPMDRKQTKNSSPSRRHGWEQFPVMNLRFYDKIAFVKLVFMKKLDR